MVDVDVVETLLDSHLRTEENRRVFRNQHPEQPPFVAELAEAETNELRAAIARARERDAGR